ncbi:hypothetical protein K503DRAFT_534868 [Rhizopogon vinicolor AM-OR11-026]|uniref:Uncharacterized protein n=1 Tax=Rhizopogon vinicolor AM-OR11-026 TaxID=1314800 RepID=A0A1B7MKY3_9AGAM|nr:hypothetical protein K503DRAFT_534868 [Rhizopogon vinicolor AM-OR11-026]
MCRVCADRQGYSTRNPCRSDNNFSFSRRQSTWCHGRQHASTAQNSLSLDHILGRLKVELQKSLETGPKLISLSMSINDIRDPSVALRSIYPHFYMLYSHSSDTSRTSISPSLMYRDNKPQAHLRPTSAPPSNT